MFARALKTLLLLALMPAAALQAAGDLENTLSEIYLSEFEAAADCDGFAARLMELLDDRSGAPEASLIYHRLAGLYNDCADQEPLDGFLLAFADREMPNGLLALEALADKSRVLIKQGQYGEAAACGAFDAYAGTVLAAGPFGFYTRSLHHVSFPPEADIDLNAAYAGYAGTVKWRLVERSDFSAEITPFRYLHPVAGCCYALYQFHLPAESPALLCFSHDGSAKIWLNEARVLDWDRERYLLPDRAHVPVQAAAGWNRILVKLSSRRSPFTLAVLDRSGRPFPDLEECADATLHPLEGDAVSGGAEADLTSIDTLEFLRSYVSESPASVPARLALADVLSRRGLEDEALREARTALELAPDSAHAACDLGVLYKTSSYLPRNFRNNRAREMFLKAVELRPDFLPARLALAIMDHENDRSEDAAAAMQSILDENPRYYKARMALIDLYQDRDWKKELRDAIEAARELAPGRGRPLEFLALFQESLERQDLAVEALLGVLERNRARTDIMEQVADFAWDRGEHKKALDIYARILQISDDDALQRKVAARHRAMGDGETARSILENLCRSRPGKPRLLISLARFLLGEGRKEEAVPLYEEALKIAPGLHEIRELLVELDVPGHTDPVFEDYGVTGEDFMKELPGKEEYPKASSILALDHMITRVYRDGSSKSRIHQVVKILDKAAVQDYGRLQIPGRIEILRTITPDGRVLEPTDAEESGAFNMPGVDAGSLVEMCYTLFEPDTLGRPHETGAFFFQDADGKQPFLFSRYVAVIPGEMDVFEELKHQEMFEREVAERGSDRVYVFTARNTPVVEPEILMPPREEAFPNVNFVQYRSPEEIAQILADLLFPGIIATEEIREKAAEVTAGAAGGMDAARRLYAFVNDHVKNDEGPQRAIEVLLEARGDRAALFMALLTAAGIEFDALRCGLNPGYLDVPVDWEKLDLDVFSRQLIRIRGDDPGETALVSMQSRMTPFGEIPDYLFGAPAVKVTGFPEAIETIPGGDPLAHMEIDIDIDVVIKGDDAEITGTLVFPGFGRSNIQEQLQRLETSRQRQVFEYNLMRSIYPGASLTDLEISGIDDAGARPTFSFKLLARDFVQTVGDRTACKLMPSPPDLTRSFVRKPDRQYPMLRRGNASYRFCMNVDLAGAYTLRRLPASLVKRRFFLNYALLTRTTERGFRVEQTMDFIPGDVPAGKYSNLIDVLTAIDERAEEPVILEPVQES